MVSRRQLIGCGVAATALGVACRLANAVESSTRPDLPTAVRSALPVSILVVDERFDVARDIASRAAPGIPRVALPRDVLDLWHGQLEPICRSRRHAIAGVTTERGLFLLQTLAADHRLRLLSRSSHDGSLVSWILGPMPGRK